MALTLADVRAICRLTLADAVGWPDASLDRWIAGAVRLYGAHFPRRWRHEIELSTGAQAYALPGGHDGAGILSVEYPAGQDPRRYLRPVAEHSPQFESGGRCYAVRGISDGVAPEDDAVALSIVFAETVHTGETAAVEYLGGHVAPAAGDDDALVTVPASHIEAITAFVQFCAQVELEADAAVLADASSVVVSQLGEQARRAWVRYKEVMDRLVYLVTPAAGVATVCWGDIGL